MLVLIGSLQSRAIKVVPARNAAAALTKQHLLCRVIQLNMVTTLPDKLLNQLGGGELYLLHGKGGLLSIHCYHHGEQCLFCNSMGNEGKVDRLLHVLRK